MKNLLQIIFLGLLLSSCSARSKLNGVWYGAYSIIEGTNYPTRETILVDFNDDESIVVRIQDLATGKLDKVTIDSTLFNPEDFRMKFESHYPHIELFEDSFMLEFENQKMVFKKISDGLRNLELESCCFKGSYVLKSDNFRDSLNFINDSVLIFTGIYETNFPGKKWQIVDYKGIKFLNINSFSFPVTIIKTCDSNRIELVYPSIRNKEVILESTTSKIDHNQLIGVWVEIRDSLSQQALLPNFMRKSSEETITIDADSFRFENHGDSLVFKWNLTSDGKRIYFLDKLLDSDGSWKLLNVTDTIMTIRKTYQSVFDNEVTRLRKMKTPGNSGF